MKMHQSHFCNVNHIWKNLPEPKDWNEESVLILCFSSPNLLGSPQPFKELNNKFNRATIVGCSTSGEILDNQVKDNSIVLTFIKFESSHFKVSIHPLSETIHSYNVGKNIAKDLLTPDLKGLLIFSEGLNANGSQIVMGLNELIPSHIPIGGGLAGDSTNFKNTFIINNGEIRMNYLAAVGFYGEALKIHSGSKGGWDIFGPERKITASKGNILFELDGKPALDLYKEYLGDKANELPASGLLFPLQITSPEDENIKLVRTILNIDESNKSLIFAGDVNQGWTAQLMRADFDRIIDASGSIYEQLVKSSSKNLDPQLIIAVSCVGRRLVLGERCEEELEALTDLVPIDSKISGFYSYGEISPISQGRHCDLHNQTMTLFILNEKNENKISNVA